MVSGKAAGSGTFEAYLCSYVENGARPRTKPETISKGLLEVPGETAHEEPRITRHEMNIIDAGCLVPQSRFKEECRLFPFRVEHVLDEEKRL